MNSGPIERAVAATIESNPQMVGRWVVGEPGSWGFLAGQAVLACRQELGRSLTDWERRQVWSLLWSRLTALKESNVGNAY